MPDDIFCWTTFFDAYGNAWICMGSLEADGLIRVELLMTATDYHALRTTLLGG